MAQRENIEFASHGTKCRGWLYRPIQTSEESPSKSPAIILGHGLGAVKEMGLDRYCEVFRDAGFACVAFDYRHFGESDGEPRQLLDIKKQHEDWSAALDYTRSLDFVDADRVGIFGSSFGGGHVIVVAARHPGRVKAVVSQCPFTNGYASARTTGTVPSVKIFFLGIRDTLFGGRKPVQVKLAGRPGDVALMNSPDAHMYNDLIPSDTNVPSTVAARLALKVPFYYPGRQAKHVSCPIFFAICGNDTVAPPGPTRKYAKQAPKGTVRECEGVGHFDIYFGDEFKKMSEEYKQFFLSAL